MPELDPVSQEFTAQNDEYLAALQAMIDQSEKLAAATLAAADAMASMGLTADDAAVTMGAAAGRANDLADAALRAGAAADAASSGIGDIAASSAVSAAALGGVTGRLDDLIMLSAVSVSELHDLRDALLGVAAAGAAGGGGGGGGGWGWWGALSTQIPLFGRALNGILPAMLVSVSVWHALADATIEFGTTLLEAATAVVTFGAFAAPTFQHIYVQLSNIWTASNALNTAIYPLSASFSSLDRAVAPEAMELFGEAIVAVNQHTNEFQQLASQAGLVLDQLGGRLVAAIGNGNDFNSFLSDGTRSLDEWGSIMGNIGGIFGNFFKTLPGYANLLTHALEGVTGALETLTGNTFAQWVMEAGLAVHGFILWTGLAVSGLLLLRGPLTAAATGFVGMVGAINAYIASIVAADGATATFEAVLTPLLNNPMVGIGIAVGAIVALGAAMAGAKDQAQQFNSTIQQLVQNAPLNQLGQTLATSVGSTSEQLATADRQVTTAQDQLSDAVGRTNSRFQPQSQTLDTARLSAQGYQEGLSKLDSQQQAFGTHMDQLTKQYGSSAAAMGLVTEAGITSQQMITTNTETWKAAEVQIQGVAAANNAMALGFGRNAAAMNALNYAGDTTNNVLGSLDVDMQKVVTGMDGINSVVAGGEQSLISFEQGLQQIQADAEAAGASINGLNAQSLTLSSDFYSTVIPAGQKLLDSMEVQLPTTRQLTTAVADVAQQWEPYATNTAAAAQIVSTINNYLGTGTVTLKNYAQWVAQNANGLQGLNQDMAQTTVQAGILANTLDSDLNASFASDILKVTGAQGALSQYTQDLANNTQNTSAGQGARAQLIKDLENSGLSAQQAEAYVNGLATALGKIVSPPAISVKVNFIAEGSQIAMQAYNASGGLTSQAVYAKTSSGIVGHGASGGMIGGYGTGTSDSNLIRASRGEYIVNAAATAAYRPLLDAVNAKRYASGGVVGSPGLVPAVLEASLTGGGGPVNVNHTSVNHFSIGTRRVLSELRTAQLTFERRNVGSGWSLGRQATPR